MRDTELSGPTRRAMLKGIAATLGVSVASTAVGHPGAGDHVDGEHPHDSGKNQRNVGWQGYHSLGSRGSESLGGSPDSPHFGGISEMKVQDDLAFVGILSSKEPTIDRGVAILDVSQYTRADSKDELENAEMFLLSFVPHENNATSVMDVKLSDDGQYAFISKQPIAVLFGDEELRTDPENVGNSPESGSLQAVDVSDPADPEIVGRWDAWGLGPHNSDHLRIGGTDYVFAVKGPTGESAGIYVVEFDRDTGHMQLVNYWTEDTNAATGEFGDPTDDTVANGNELYMHDIRVERDPQTGWPIAYAANWNNGGLVLDVSDPTEIRQLGKFDMNRCHEIWPATVTDGDGEPHRVYVCGQENPDSNYGSADNETGFLYLVDAQEIDPPEQTAGEETESKNLGTASNLDPDAEKTELGKWLLADFASDKGEDGQAFDNYTLSLHNVEPFEVEVPVGNSSNSRTQTRQFIAAGHYHAGIRLLEFTEVFHDDVNVDYIGNDNSEWPDPPYNGDDGLGQVGYFRSHPEVPEDSKLNGLTGATPDFWCGVEENGVIFGSGINTGAYAITLDDPDVPVGSRTPVDVDVERARDSSVFLGGGTMRVTLSVETDEEVLVRDRIPREWDTYGYGDDHVTYDAGDGNLVEFTTPVEPGEHVGHGHDHEDDGSARTRTYFAEIGGDGGATLGPVEYSVDGGDTWDVVPGTVDSNLVVGDSTPL